MSAAARRLVIRSELAELERLLAFITGFCESFEIADDTKYKLLLVVEELTVNAINHGYAGEPNGRIEIGLERGHGEVVVVIEDEAPPFNPLADRAMPDLGASLEDREIGGLGIHFVRTLSASAEYRFEGGRNVVRAILAEAA